MRRLLTGGLALAALVFPAAAGAVEYAPVDRPGPALSVPQATLDAALVCSPDVAGATRAPVILVPGTGATAEDNWSWTYVPAFNAAGIPWCTVDPPDHSTGDIQIAGEYIVNAIRTAHARSGRKVSVIGHSQGGMSPRFALRFWPDLRPMVDDAIGFAASNHGTTLAGPTCSGGCSPSNWQQRNDSNFISAVNSVQETFPGISYTSVYTRTDEIVQPNLDDTGSSSLRPGDGPQIQNVATQDVCPTAVYEHLMIGTIDPVAYALALDALDHPGPADPSRVSLLTCLQVFHPGIDPVTGPGRALEAAASFLAYSGPEVPAEPELRCYILAAGCGANPAAGAESPYSGKKKCAKKKKKAKGKKKKRKRCKKKGKKKRKR